MISLAEYRAKFEEHDSVTDENVQECVDIANDDVSSEYLGHMHKRAQLYYAAHYVQTDYPPAAALGSTASIDVSAAKKLKMGGLEVEFRDNAGSTSSSDSDLENTKYGKQYLSLVRGMVGPVTL